MFEDNHTPMIHRVTTTITLQDFLASPPVKETIVAADEPTNIFDLNSSLDSHKDTDFDGVIIATTKSKSATIVDCGDRRNKRQIKNRESAARSRARKQAYINELEHELSRLTKDNIKLQNQVDELRLVMATQLPTKKRLQRTTTAPF